MDKVKYLLDGEERKNFDKLVSQFAQQNTPKVVTAYATSHAPKGISLQNIEFVHLVINYYIEYSVLNNVYYTNNQETTYLNDPFFKYIFIKYNGSIKTDIGLRDHIWTIVSSCMSVADKNTDYTYFWKPYTMNLTSEEKTRLMSKINTTGTLSQNKGVIIAGLAMLGLVVMNS